MDQIKLHVQQLVAEALTIMNPDGLSSLPVYDGDRIVGKLTYDEMIAFLDDNENEGGIYTHRLHFDVGSALIAIKEMRSGKYKTSLQDNVSKKLVVVLSSVAAIGVILLGLAWFSFKPAPSAPAAQNNIVVSGLNKVMLTLTNGEHVALNGSKKGVVIDGLNLTYSDGTAVPAGQSQSSQGADNENALAVSTSNGGMYQLTLPDGTNVWLNAASSLKFPSTFAGVNQRRVQLHGEAYFEVAKNKKMPFIVESKGQEIEVLGTHFNVSAYGNEGSVRTTLLEGMVRVTPIYQNEKLLKSPDPSSLDPLELIKNDKAELRAEQAVVLTPNHQAILSGSGITVTAVNADEAVAWKKGEFIFRNMPLENIMKVVARWYDVDVSYERSGAGKALLGGTIAKSSTIADVLKTLELTANVHFKLNGRKITVIQ